MPSAALNQPPQEGTAAARIEPLEPRVLLSTAWAAAAAAPAAKPAPFTAKPWQAAAAVRDKAALVDRAGSALASLAGDYADFRARGGVPNQFRPRDELLNVANDAVAVEAFARPGQGAALEKQLRGLGLAGAKRRGPSVSGRLPLGAIARLASLPAARFVQPIWMRTRAGSVASQTDPAQRGDVARTAAPVTGAGVKVGVLSDSFDTSSNAVDYAADVASGDLPAGVQILADSPGGTDEGRAMAQLVYDTAPGAALAFATANGGQAAFASNIRALRAAGADVIVDDILYLAEPMFQDGLVAKAVDEVVAAGASYFSSAGNEGRNAYESTFRPALLRPEGTLLSAPGGPTFGGGLTHDFDPGPLVDDTQAFTLQPGESILLSFQWDQPYFSATGAGPGSASDVDIYVLDATGLFVLDGAFGNNLGNDPVEVLFFENDGAVAATYNLMIANFDGPNPGLMKYVNFGDPAFTEYNTDSGTVYGHANAAGAAAVGAAAFINTPAFGLDPPQVNDYSSAGTTPILFGPTGARLPDPVVRQKPQIVAPDGGNTTFFGSDVFFDEDASPNFFGTSAAAPAAAGVAALLLDRRPGLSPARVYAALEETAIDMDDPATAGFDAGADAASGFGLIRADAALASLLPRVQAFGVNDGSPQRSKVASLTVNFSTPVTLEADAFGLVRRASAPGGGDATPVAVTAAPASGGGTYVLTFPTALVLGSLPDGVYDLTVRAAAVRDEADLAPAADAVFSFHRLFSDGDGDGDSDNADLFQVRSTYNKQAADPGFIPYFDYDEDGDVDNADLFQVRARRGVAYTV